MKKFEKWLKTFYKNHRGYMRFEPTAEMGWRAALEMVLKKENVVRFCWRAEYKSEEAIPTIYDDIREELEK